MQILKKEKDEQKERIESLVTELQSVTNEWNTYKKEHEQQKVVIEDIVE